MPHDIKRSAGLSPTLLELRRQLRLEMAVAGYQATNLLIAIDDVIDLERLEGGHDACVYFLALWVRLLREENRARGAC